MSNFVIKSAQDRDLPKGAILIAPFYTALLSRFRKVSVTSFERRTWHLPGRRYSRTLHHAYIALTLSEEVTLQIGGHTIGPFSCLTIHRRPKGDTVHPGCSGHPCEPCDQPDARYPRQHLPQGFQLSDVICLLCLRLSYIPYSLHKFISRHSWAHCQWHSETMWCILADAGHRVARSRGLRDARMIRWRANQALDKAWDVRARTFKCGCHACWQSTFSDEKISFPQAYDLSSSRSAWKR